MKKFFSILLAALLTLSLCATAFAAEITINSNTADPGLSVDGKTFNAYKVLDLVDADGGIYAAAGGLEDFFADRYELDKTDKYFNEQLTAALKAEIEATDFDGFAFAAELLAAAKAVGIKAVSAVGANDSATITDLAVGYYVVEDAGAAGDENTAISALMLQKTDDSPAITVKGSMPTITKDILDSDVAPEDDGAEDHKKPYNNGSIGEKVPYVLTSKVPSRMDAYDAYTYVIHDEMSKGLTFQNDVVITIDGVELDESAYTVTTAAIDEDGEYEGGTAITIEILNFIQYKDNAGDEIAVYYSAEINEDAVIGEELGNPNRVRLEYSNNPNYTEEPGEPGQPGDEPIGPTGITPWDEVRTYVTEVKIIKTDANGNRLIGAQFTLVGERVEKVLVETLKYTEDANGTFWKLTDGSYTTQDPAAEGMDQSKYASTTVKYKQELIVEVQEKTASVTITGVTNDAGELIFSGLGSGSYTLTEIKAPEGYNLLKQPIELTISWTEPTAPAKDCIWAYKWTNADGQGNVVTVVNNVGVVLPETGGMGTTVFYLAGGLLVVAAAVLLITKKRMNRE